MHLSVVIQGTPKSVNTINDIAEEGVKISEISAEVILSVETIASFAENPDITAEDACHEPNPSGEKTGDIAFPKTLRIELSASHTEKPASCVDRNHTAAEETRTVKSTRRNISRLFRFTVLSTE